MKQLSRLEVTVSYTKPYQDNLLPENTFFTTTWGKTINSIQQHITNSSAAPQKAHVEAAPAPSSSHGTAREAGAPLCYGTGTLQAAVESQGHLCVPELHPAKEASKEQLWHQALPENGSHLKEATCCSTVTLILRGKLHLRTNTLLYGWYTIVKAWKLNRGEINLFFLEIY